VSPPVSYLQTSRSLVFEIVTVVWNVCPNPFVGTHRAVCSSPRPRPPRPRFAVVPLLSSCQIKRYILIRLVGLIRLRPSRLRAPLSLRLLPQLRALPAVLSLSHSLAPRLPPVCIHPHTPLTILPWIRKTREISTSRDSLFTDCHTNIRFAVAPCW
jgi:hypothetical protein